MLLPVILLIFSSFTLLSAIIVLLYSAISWKRTHHFYLAGFFVSIVLYYFPFILSITKLLHHVPHTLKSGIVFYFMIPAFLSLYIKSFFTTSFYFKKKYLLFLVLPFIAFLDYLFFHVMNNNQLADIANMAEKNNLSLYKLEGFVPYEINIIIRFLYILPFWYYVIKMIYQYSKKQCLSPEEAVTLTFVKYLSFALLYAYVIFFTNLVFPILGNKLEFTDSLRFSLLFSAGIIILFLSLSILLRPQLLFDLKEMQKKVGKIAVESLEESNELLNAIESKMIEEKFYLNEKFSRQDVVIHFNITRNKLDELLTHIKGLSFADWLNTLRIEYAKSLLSNNDNHTIDAISSMSGYSSRSAFYAAFKKVTNITPTEFIRREKSNSEELK